MSRVSRLCAGQVCLIWGGPGTMGSGASTQELAQAIGAAVAVHTATGQALAAAGPTANPFRASLPGQQLANVLPGTSENSADSPAAAAAAAEVARCLVARSQVIVLLL